MIRRLIDTHVHIWDLDNVRYPWLDGDQTVLNRSYAIGELEPQLKEARVTHGIFVQAADSYEDTDYMLEMCAVTPWILGAVCWLPLTDPDQTEKILEEKYLKNPCFKGVRHLIHFDSNPQWLLQPTVIRSLGILAKKNIPYDVVGTVPEHIETALKVGEKIPELQMVFDHLNQPPISIGERFGHWGALMKEASRHPNFWIKISGLGTATKKKSSEWGVQDIKPYVSFCLEHFGEDRAFCGGDWPVSLLANSYSRTWEIYITLLENLLPVSALDKVFSGNAERFYKLK